jgi:hypothetical protein
MQLLAEMSKAQNIKSDDGRDEDTYVSNNNNLNNNYHSNQRNNRLDTTKKLQSNQFPQFNQFGPLVIDTNMTSSNMPFLFYGNNNNNNNNSNSLYNDEDEERLQCDTTPIFVDSNIGVTGESDLETLREIMLGHQYY